MECIRSVIISGASGNLGLALARRFAEEEYRLVLLCRKDHDSILTRIPTKHGKPLVLEGDLAKSESIDNLFRRVSEHGIRPDVLINNAGVQTSMPLKDIDGIEWDHMLNINLRVPHLCTCAFATLWNASDFPEGRCVVNIASIEGENPALNHSHYDASKAGLIQYTKAAALELGRDRIRVNCVSPGLIHRPGIEEAWPDGFHRYTHASPIGRLVSPQEVADAVFFLSSPASSGIDGINLRVDAGVGATTGY